MAQDNAHWTEMSQSYDGNVDPQHFLPNFGHNGAYSSRPPFDARYAAFSSSNATGLAIPDQRDHHPAVTRSLTPAQATAAARRFSIQPSLEPTRPIDRMYREAGPWSAAQAISDAGGQGQGPRFMAQGHHSVVRPPAAAPPPPFAGYRDAHSNPESSHLTDNRNGGGGGHGAGGPHDSGYGTAGPHATSVASGVEPVETLGETQSYANDLEHIQLQQGAGPPVGPTHYVEMIPQHQAMMGIEGPQLEPEEPQGLQCHCGDGGFKNQSELRKHKQKHEKAHRCDVQGCNRRDGFSTKNDLDRHKKSRHNIRPRNGNDRSYRCAGSHCPKRGKIWPRLDNFKAHCTRMHSQEKLQDLIRKSQIEEDSPPPVEYVSVTPQRLPMDSAQSAGASMMNATPLLAGLSQPPSHVPYQHVVEQPAFRHVDARRPVDVEEEEEEDDDDDDGRPVHDPSQIRYSETPKPSRQQQQQQQQQQFQIPTTSNAVEPSSMPQSPTTIAIDDDPAVDSHRGVHSLASTQPSATKKRKLDGGSSLTPSDQADELSKSIIAEVLKGNSSPDSMQSAIAARVREALDAAAQLAAAEGDGEDGEPATKQKRLECKICFKTMDRQCDLKKHEKRHSRPWGCTNETCSRTFGSKNDWKRHENSQHYQLETWRCHEASATSRIGQCARLFFRRDPFQAHLRRDHQLRDEDYVRDQCRQRRVGRNFQNGFWCGFCKAIVRLQTKGLDAWDERFNHIDFQHFKRGQCIDDWFPMDKDVPKGRLRRPTDDRTESVGSSTVFDDESASDDDDEDDDDDFDPDRQRHERRARRRAQRPQPQPLDAVPPPPPPQQQMVSAQTHSGSSFGSQGGPCSNCRKGWIEGYNDVCEFCGVQAYDRKN